MKINEINIQRYGILQNKVYTFNNDTNIFLIFGENESGKTLTIDALSRLLLPKKPDPSKQPGKFGFKDNEINRVDYFPEGYLMMTDFNGKERKLSEKGSFFDGLDIPYKSLRNIFIIRNSDMFIEDEESFYKNVTNHITGMRIEDIDKIKQKIREQNRLTGKLGFSNRESDFKLADRLKEAESLSQEIEELMDESFREQYDTLEEDYLSCQEEKSRLYQQLEEYEQAYYRELYEKGDYYYNQLLDAKEKLRQLASYTEDKLNQWNNCLRDLENHRTELKEKKDKLDQLGQKHSEIVAQKEEREKTLAQYEHKITGIQELEPELEKAQQWKENLAGKDKSQKIMLNLWKFFAVLFGITLMGVLVNPESWIYILSGILALPTLLLVIPRITFARESSQFNKFMEKLKHKVASCGIEGSSLDQIIRNISTIKSNRDAIHKEVYEKLLPRQNALQENIKDLEGHKLPELTEKINSIDKEIKELQLSLGVETVDEFSAKLTEKQKQERILENAASVLDSIFSQENNQRSNSLSGESSDRFQKLIGNNLDFWKQKIDELKKFADKAPGIRYSQGEIANLKTNIKNLEDKMEEINKQIKSYHDKLDEIAKRAEKALYPDDTQEVICRTTKNLEDIKRRLDKFVSENDMIKEAAKSIDDIFNEIISEEQEKMQELFSKNSKLQHYFSELTCGNYHDVTYDRETNQLFCWSKDGMVLEAEKLSGFAYDQLYFSIRLVLAEKILGNKQGFLILDDPFIKADYNRLSRQIDMIKRISALGWQIIYFSAKNEVKEVLSQDIDSGQVHLFDA